MPTSSRPGKRILRGKSPAAKVRTSLRTVSKTTGREVADGTATGITAKMHVQTERLKMRRPRTDFSAPAIITALMLTLCCCSGKRNEFSAFREMPESGWVYGVPVVFTPMHPADTLITGPLYLTVRHNDTYPYANIWLEIEADGFVDTLNIRLADIYGNWTGKGHGSTKEITVNLLEKYTHHSGDTIRLRHILRTDTLKGISAVGLQLNP